MLDQRGRLLRAALGFAGCSLPSYDRALWALRTWLDSWSGIGRVAVGMARQGFDLQLTRYDEKGWPPTFPARVPLSIDDRPGNRDRQAHRKSRPFSLAGTLSTDASSMRFNQMANKSESETEPRVASGAAAVTLSEAFEDMGEQVSGEPA